jgi:hypothetical protein
VSCPDCEMIEIKSKNVKNTIQYEVELPIIDGDTSYQRVASTFDYTTDDYTTDTIILNLIEGDTINDDISF